MNDARKEKLKINLVEMGLMEQDDTIVDCFQANYYEKLLGVVGQWKQGWIYFTEKRLIYPTGVLEKNVIIPYENIRGIEKCMQTIFPMGIAIAYENLSTGDTQTNKFSMMGRGKWIKFLKEKSSLHQG